MALVLFNTLTRSLEPFQPLNADRIGVYACGPTVYQPPHIGNYRTFLFSDLLHRYLGWKGFQVRLVMNLTDVDDRIIERAGRGGVDIQQFTEPYVRGFLQDLDVLGALPAASYPRATHHIPAMIALVQQLLERGHAYEVDGSVYFSIASFPDYGKLSRIPLDQVRTGERVADDRYDKEDIRDFALWKSAKDEDRAVGAVWAAPWGEGRPGWHLECSAMSIAELGDTFDIHVGGEDLIFPHHEDEIAQSEAATGRPFARFWLHTKHLLISAEKMSKSSGLALTLEELLDKGYSPAAIRFLLLSAHYRKELNFSYDGIADGQAAIRRLTDFEDRLAGVRIDDAASGSELPRIADTALAAFQAALDDDLNSPAALAALFTFVRETNSELDRTPTLSAADAATARDCLARIDHVLNLVGLARRRSTLDPDLVRWVEDLLAQRQDARARRDFARADAIRGELAAAGIVVEDTPEGPRWKWGD
jgi:cysteinyl-tRNA synthetase